MERGIDMGKLIKTIKPFMLALSLLLLYSLSAPEHEKLLIGAFFTGWSVYNFSKWVCDLLDNL